MKYFHAIECGYFDIPSVAADRYAPSFNKGHQGMHIDKRCKPKALGAYPHPPLITMRCGAKNAGCRCNTELNTVGGADKKTGTPRCTGRRRPMAEVWFKNSAHHASSRPTDFSATGLTSKGF